MRGYCPACDQLVILIAGDWRKDRRQRYYWTAQHEHQGKPGEGGRI